MKGCHTFAGLRKNRLAHDSRISVLVENGWVRNNGYWISPRTKISYSEMDAVSVEELRGSFRKSKRGDKCQRLEI